MSCECCLLLAPAVPASNPHAQSQTCSTSCTVSPIATIESGPASNPPLGNSAEYTERRSRYKFGKTLGAGTYGIVREADCPEGKVAVKIILKKNVRGNEQMVYDELEMLQRMKHPHIVKFHDWFESRVSTGALDPCEAEPNLRRTNTTSSPNWRRAESCSTGSARRASSRRRTRPRRSVKSSTPSTISTTTMSSTEVECLFRSPRTQADKP
jgi:hypothetical protein